MQKFLFAITATLVLGACAESESTEVEYSSVVSAVLHANVGPNGESQEFVVEVSHDDERVTREQARRLAANVRIQQEITTRRSLGDDVVPADGHWGEEDDHGFRVTVRPVIDEDRADHLEHLAWGWLEEAMAALHCPPGH